MIIFVGDGLISKDQYDQWRAILLQEDQNNVN